MRSAASSSVKASLRHQVMTPNGASFMVAGPSSRVDAVVSVPKDNMVTVQWGRGADEVSQLWFQYEDAGSSIWYDANLIPKNGPGLPIIPQGQNLPVPFALNPPYKFGAGTFVRGIGMSFNFGISGNLVNGDPLSLSRLDHDASHVTFYFWLHPGASGLDTVVDIALTLGKESG